MVAAVPGWRVAKLFETDDKIQQVETFHIIAWAWGRIRYRSKWDTNNNTWIVIVGEWGQPEIVSENDRYILLAPGEEFSWKKWDIASNQGDCIKFYEKDETGNETTFVCGVKTA